MTSAWNRGIVKAVSMFCLLRLFIAADTANLQHLIVFVEQIDLYKHLVVLLFKIVVRGLAVDL